MSKKKSKKKSKSKGKSKKAHVNKVTAPKKVDKKLAEEKKAEEEKKAAEEKKAEEEKKAAEEKEREDNKREDNKREEEKKAEEEKEAAEREEERRALDRRAASRRAEDRRAADRLDNKSLAEEPEAEPPTFAPPSFWQRHDLGVLFFALAVFVGGILITRQLSTPKQIEFSQSGLLFERPVGWLPAQSATTKSAGLASTASGFGVASAGGSIEEPGQHILYQSPRDARQRIEIQIGPRPPYRNLRGARAIERLGQYGEFYWEAASSSRSIARRDWVRTEFRYAFKPSKSGSPQIANAVEYATIQDTRLYVVTLHGDPKSMTALDKLIAPTLRIANAGEVTSESGPAAEATP
jgi:hypothetical protein